MQADDGAATLRIAEAAARPDQQQLHPGAAQDEEHQEGDSSDEGEQIRNRFWGPADCVCFTLSLGMSATAGT